MTLGMKVTAAQEAACIQNPCGMDRCESCPIIASAALQVFAEWLRERGAAVAKVAGTPQEMDLGRTVQIGLNCAASELEAEAKGD